MLQGWCTAELLINEVDLTFRASEGCSSEKNANIFQCFSALTNGLRSKRETSLMSISAVHQINYFNKTFSTSKSYNLGSLSFFPFSVPCGLKTPRF